MLDRSYSDSFGSVLSAKMNNSRRNFSHVALDSEGIDMNQSFDEKKSCPERPSIADM